MGGNVRPDFPLYKSSTLGTLNVPELLAECEESSFGKGTEAVLDHTVRKSWEIPMPILPPNLLAALRFSMNQGCFKLAPNHQTQLRPYKLVIYQEGGHFDAHRDTVRGDGHIGTLVLILNSDYTGGELEITHNGQTEVVTGPYSWVAMYGDCLHKINPVTSGTRVSLIFDIYVTGVSADEGFFWQKPYESVKSEPAASVQIVECTRTAVLSGVEKELSAVDTLIICLAHKYPLHQATPAYLKGGDRALYELLKDEFDTEVVACTVDHYYCPDFDRERRVRASLFTSFVPPAAPKVLPYGQSRDTLDKRTKIVIPSAINAESILDYSPYAEHAGNEPQAETSMYLVSGLQLRRRA
jgi:hypothetical protein